MAEKLQSLEVVKGRSPEWVVQWRLGALLFNAIAVGSFALIAVTSDKVWHEYFKVLGGQFNDIIQFYGGCAWYAVIAGGSIAIATALIEVVHWRLKSGNTALNISANSLLAANLVIGVANIVANLVPMIFIILLNAVIWLLLIAFSIAILALIVWIIFKIFGGEGSTSRGSVQSPKAPDQMAALTKRLDSEARQRDHYREMDGKPREERF